MGFFDGIVKFYKVCTRLIVDLFTDQVKENGNVRKISLHRTILMILVGVALNTWIMHLEIPATMMTFLFTITGVVFGDKALATIKTFGKNGGQNTVVADPEEHGD